MPETAHDRLTILKFQAKGPSIAKSFVDELVRVTESVLSGDDIDEMNIPPFVRRIVLAIVAD